VRAVGIALREAASNSPGGVSSERRAAFHPRRGRSREVAANRRSTDHGFGDRVAGGWLIASPQTVKGQHTTLLALRV